MTKILIETTNRNTDARNTINVASEETNDTLRLSSRHESTFASVVVCTFVTTKLVSSKERKIERKFLNKINTPLSYDGREGCFVRSKNTTIALHVARKGSGMFTVRN